MGWKYGLRWVRYWDLAVSTLNRTIVGWKFIDCQNLPAPNESLNRTIVGWKLNWMWWSASDKETLNRTIVGWKFD